MNLDDAPDVLTVPEAAQLLRIGRNQAYAMVAAGELYAARCGRSLRVPKAAVLRLLGADPPNEEGPGGEPGPEVLDRATTEGLRHAG